MYDTMNNYRLPPGGKTEYLSTTNNQTLINVSFSALANRFQDCDSTHCYIIYIA